MTYLPANARYRALSGPFGVRDSRRLAVAGRVSMVVADLAVIWGAFFLAWAARYRYHIGGQVYSFNDRPFSDFFSRIALFSGIFLVVALLRGIYRVSPWTSLLDETGLVVGTVTISMAALILLAYLSQYSPSRLLFLYAWLATNAGMLLVRVAWRRIREASIARGFGVRHVLIVGGGSTGQRSMQLLMSTPGLGLRVAGYVDDDVGSAALVATTDNGKAQAQRLGAIDDVPSIFGRHRIDEVILALPSTNETRSLEIAHWCRAAGVPFRVVPDLLQLSLDRVQLEEISGVPLISMREPRIAGPNAVLKRSMDLFGAGLALVVASIPVGVLLVWLRLCGSRVRTTEETMVGRHGVPFRRKRFRVVTASGDGGLPEMLWSRIRADGVPQLLDVLRGDMSLIGPRPEPLDRAARWLDWQRQRLLVQPGLTGLWATEARSELTYDEMIRLDLFYAEHWSAWMDAKIAIRSVYMLVKDLVRR